MERLIEGHKRFLAEVFPGLGSQFHLLAEMQAPEWLLITCSDSRVVPDLFLGTGPGDLFKHAILCGHSDCGALKAALDHKSLEGLPKAKRWLSHVESAFAYRQPLNPADGESAELASLIRGNVVAQLKNLQVQPTVLREVALGKLTVHGWYYDILSGRIEEYDEAMGRFVPWVE